MLSYYHLVHWHNKSIAEDETNSRIDLEDNFNREYIKKKLEGGLSRVWHDVQTKISISLMNSDLAWYKFEQFVQVLSIVHR